MDEELIPILRVANAADAVTWYERLGFTKEWEHRFEPGMPAFVSIARGRARMFSPSIRVMPGQTPWSTW
jgi:uncharacterized glyoxalase superfamily protein PhnB